MPYRLVSFDFDGTLADSFGWFVNAMGPVADRYRFRRADPADLEMLRGLSGPELLRYLRLSKWKLPFVAAHVRRLQLRQIDQIQMFAGMGELLRSLATRNVSIGVVSSNAERNVRGVLGPELCAHIRHFGCGSSLTGKRSKLKTMLKRLRVSAPESLYVGDEPRDIEAANAVGMHSAAVTWGYASRTVLRDASPTFLFDTPAELNDAIMA